MVEQARLARIDALMDAEPDSAEFVELSYRPTIIDRLRRKAGYRFHYADEPPEFDPAKHVGWMKTVTTFKFDFADRIRLLLTGRLRIEIAQYTTQQVDESVNAVSYKIFAPLECDR